MIGKFILKLLYRTKALEFTVEKNINGDRRLSIIFLGKTIATWLQTEQELMIKISIKDEASELLKV